MTWISGLGSIYAFAFATVGWQMSKITSYDTFGCERYICDPAFRSFKTTQILLKLSFHICIPFQFFFLVLILQGNFFSVHLPFVDLVVIF